MLKLMSRLIEHIRNTRSSYYKTKIAESDQCQDSVALFLDNPEEKSQERTYRFSYRFQEDLRIADGHSLYLKWNEFDYNSDPDKHLEYYTFIERDEHGGFVAKYSIFIADQFERPSQSYGLYWKYDGNDQFLYRGELKTAFRKR